MDWFKIGKEVQQACILSFCLFDFYAQYHAIFQAGIKVARTNINNLRYADDTTLMAESEEELKSLLMKMIEESGNAVLKLNIQKTKIMTSGPISSVQFSSVTYLCPTLCDPMDYNTPGFPVHYQLPELTKTHVH